MTDSSNLVVPLRKIATGVRGLDEVLLGGIPAGRTTVIAGSTGTGKTVLALEFLIHNARQGEPGIFVTFEERAEAVRANARAMGWDLQELEASGKLVIVQPELPSNVLASGKFTIDGLLAILTGHTRRIQAKNIAIDALDVLLRVFERDCDQQNQLILLNRWLLQSDLTALLTIKWEDGEAGLHRYLAYLVDCVVRLDQSITGQVTTRRLRIVKYRGSGFRSNQYPYIISEGGLDLIPVTGIELDHPGFGQRLSSGNTELDLILGGGYRYASSVLISGSTGTGKTTFVASFARAACANNCRVLFVSFEESADALTSAMAGIGIGLQEHVDSGRLQVISVMPEAVGAEEHLIRILKVMDQFQPDHLIVDPISGSMRIGTEKAAFDFMIRLVLSCKERGVTGIYTDQTPPAGAEQNNSGLGTTAPVDTVLLLEQVWVDNAHERRLLVLKSRGSSHSNRFHSFAITDTGLHVQESGARSQSTEEKIR